MLFRRFALALALLVGIVGSQVPEFAQQYRQRLGGAIDELNRMITQFDADAAAQGLSRSAALDRLKSNSDLLATERAEAIDRDYHRLQRLIEQRDRFVQAGPVARLFVLARDLDPGVASNAVNDFEPAVPTTGEGLITAAVGFFLGGGLLHLLAWPVRRRARLKAAARLSHP
jgi:Protein of unknown function (DUF2937)